MNKSHCIIIGVGPGLGKSLVRKFGEAGFMVSMLSRNHEHLSACKKEFDHLHLDTEYFLADAGEPRNIANSIKSAIDHFGKPAVLIYNAAALHPGKLLEHFAEEFIEDFKVNVAGAIQAVQSAVTYMDRLEKASILLTGGGLKNNPSKDYASLTLGKAGIYYVAQMLNQELASTRIKVATVTINGFMKKGTSFDPDLVAQRYLEIHQNPKKFSNVEVSALSGRLKFFN